jgi:hypothetical protein
MRRLITTLAAFLIVAPGYTQAVTQTGAVQSVGGIPLDLAPGTIFRQACNGGLGGIVGQSYGGTECGLPTTGGGGGGGGAVTAAPGSYAAGSIVDLGSGASPAANTVNSRLATINSTLGNPFQAGGTIGNTTFGATQVGIWSVILNAGTNAIGSITNTAFGATQSGTWNVGLNSGTNAIGSITNTTFGATQSGTWNLANITGTVTLPTNAAQETGGNLASIATNTASGAVRTAVGNVASGATDTGNPVKTGCVYNSTKPTITTGQRVDCQAGPGGSAQVSISQSSLTNGADSVSNTNQMVRATGGDGNNGYLATWSFVFDGTTWDRQRGDPTGTWAGGHSSVATGQVSVTTTSTQVVAARTGRQKLILSVGAANTCAFGNTGVTTTTGFPLQPTAGASVTLDTGAAIFAACSATTTISYIEEF